MTTIERDWRSLVLEADPDHTRKSRYVIEYEFTSPGGFGRPETHEGGMRVFRGNYDQRGAYRAETIAGNGLIWGGMLLRFAGNDLVWGDA